MKNLFVAAFLVCSITSYAQHQELHEDPKLWGKSSKLLDSSNKNNGFKLGTIHGNLRSFFSSNFNKNSDIEYAQAVGGGIQFISKPVYHVKLGVSGFFVYDAFSSDLTKAHPLSGALNRYELGLFDITDPANKTGINRIEELYLQYQKNKTTFTVGKQLINTPFINLQDGRMRPTAAQGLWLQHKNKENKWYAGWLNKFSPRSTVAWYNTGASIGLYSVGVNMDGTKSGYKNALESSGAALVGAELNILKNHSIQVSNLWVQNIFNSSLVQLDKTPTTKHPYYYGLQLITQTVVNKGGNNDAAKTYFNPDQSSLVMGARLGKKVGAWDYSLNYTRITKQGRYLMPREWGRDPFYTFLMGERNEGVGGVSAYVLKAKYKAPKAPLTVQVGAGYFNLPDVTNYALNKYALPSYVQYNLDVRYVFAKHLKGWEAQLIYFYKDATGNTYNNPKYYINKVDMGHFNFIVNFHF
ncbi:MAG: hypothetical protein RLZZ75_131 [Bacteroidota bacterium]|jgi:hypothetical protein